MARFTSDNEQLARDIIARYPRPKSATIFYEMFKRNEVGTYLINVCTNISCQLLGGEELLAHAADTLGIAVGGTTPDGLFTLEDVECIAACTEAPACAVNYRYLHQVTHDQFTELVAELRAGTRSDIPPHGTLGKVRQDLAGDRIANISPPEAQDKPVWIKRHEDLAALAVPADGAGS